MGTGEGSWEQAGADLTGGGKWGAFALGMTPSSELGTKGKIGIK